MRASTTSHVLLLGLFSGLASAWGCSSGGNDLSVFEATTMGDGAAGSTTEGMVCTGGPSTMDASGTGGPSGSSDGSVDGGDPITNVAPTPGCGVDPAPCARTGRYTIQTTGSKAADCADSKCGPWSYLREFYVILPVGYDNTKAYPLVFQTPGCGGTGLDGYPLTTVSGSPQTANVDNTVIRVGLTPPPNDIGHATNPGQSCFDESEGDDSVDFVFYEDLYDQLASQLCFDKNRVFTNGSGSGGGRISDELACRYAGDAKRPVRGVISNSGDWTTNPKFLPTCTSNPMAGMWVHQTDDTTRPWSSAKLAIARAMMVDGCTIGTGYDDATFDDFPIGSGNPDNTCQRIKGCRELTPLVVCLIPGNSHSSNDSVVNPGGSAFIKLFGDLPTR